MVQGFNRGQMPTGYPILLQRDAADINNLPKGVSSKVFGLETCDGSYRQVENWGRRSGILSIIWVGFTPLKVMGG